MKKIEIYKLDKNATLPTRNHEGDAGLDLYALEDVFIYPGQTCLIKTGIAAKIPEGYVGLLRERSSIGKKGLKLAGGVIDAGYSGDISVLLINISNMDGTKLSPTSSNPIRGYKVESGERIAQLILMPIITPTPVEVDQIWDSNRGNKGFGSSGR